MIINSLSVFFLVYNDEHTIGKLVRDADKLLAKLNIDYEIIAGNDASRDGSLVVLEGLKKEFPRFSFYTNKTNQGYGGNLQIGLSKAKNEFVFYTDSDGQYDVKELALLIKNLKNGVDVVNGYKKSRSDAIHRVVLGNLYAKIVRFLFKIKIRDVDCDFRLMRNSILKKFKLTSKSGAVCTELVLKLQNAGANFVEAGVNHYPRLHGSSQFFKFKRLKETFIEELRLYMEFKNENIRKAEFILVGLTSLMVQATFFELFYLFFKITPTLSSIIADQFAILSSYVLNESITFADKSSHRLGLRNLAKYYLIVIFSTFLQAGIMYIGTNYFIDSILAVHLYLIMGIFSGIIWNYSLQNFFIWKR